MAKHSWLPPGTKNNDWTTATKLGKSFTEARCIAIRGANVVVTSGPRA